MIISELRTVEHRARVAQVAKEEQRSTDDVVVSLAAGMRASEIKLLAEPNVHTWEELEKPSSFDTLQSRVIAQPTYDLVAYLSGRAAQAYETEATLNDLIEKNGDGRTSNTSPSIPTRDSDTIRRSKCLSSFTVRVFLRIMTISV